MDLTPYFTSFPIDHSFYILDTPVAEYDPAPLPRSTVITASSHIHAMLPPMIHPDPNDPSSKLGSDSRTFNKRLNLDAHSEADPYAAAFLREQLGDKKWTIFAARLCERRIGGPKESNPSNAATLIDFMIKVEAVKDVLRTFVPHPYNPLKSLKHTYTESPMGEVTLTRATVLALSGWSNTQFSYWARRVEAVSMLAAHDEQLCTLRFLLERRLRDNSDSREEPSFGSSTFTRYSASQELEYIPHITGKSLDGIIDAVKKRTGASQFLRGKHSSLDPFGVTSSSEDDKKDITQPVFTPVFQATEYMHSLPSTFIAVNPPARPARHTVAKAGSAQLNTRTHRQGHKKNAPAVTPVPDALSELENVPHCRKRGGGVLEALSKKKTR